MMYAVVKITFKPYTEETLFKSSVLNDCWEYIRTNISKDSVNFSVKNSIGEFVDPPIDIRRLITSYNRAYAFTDFD